MPQAILYGFDPLATLRLGLAPTTLHSDTPLQVGPGVARPFLFGFDPMVTLLLGMAQPAYAEVDPDIKARAVLQLQDPALYGSWSNKAIVIEGRLIIAPGDVLTVWEVRFANQLDTANGEHLTALGTTPQVIALDPNDQRSDATAVVMQGLTVNTSTDIIRVAMSGAVAGSVYILTLSALDNQGATHVIEISPIECRGIPAVTS